MPGNTAPLRATGGASSRSAPTTEGGARGPINAAAGGAPDATFPRTVRKVFKAITSTTQETIMLRIPWGPRLSVLFDPRNAIGIAGGSLNVYAVVESSQIPLSTTAIGATPLRVLEEAACDSYLVTATLGTPLAAGATQNESYVYAGTYAGSV
ncbi:MAG: hypothetical protein ACLQVI_22545 [Polyangiaceae bacterium]